jgi:hypothetical protein
MSYLHVPMPDAELDAFHGVARARGLLVKTAVRQALKLWVETVPGNLPRGFRSKLAVKPHRESDSRNVRYANPPEAAAVFDSFIEKVTAYQAAARAVPVPVIDVPGEPVPETPTTLNDEITTMLDQLASDGEF